MQEESRMAPRSASGNEGMVVLFVKRKQAWEQIGPQLSPRPMVVVVSAYNLSTAGANQVVSALPALSAGLLTINS